MDGSTDALAGLKQGIAQLEKHLIGAPDSEQARGSGADRARLNRAMAVDMRALPPTARRSPSALAALPALCQPAALTRVFAAGSAAEREGGHGSRSGGGTDNACDCQG